jgi:hypothetical protein
VVQEVRVRRRMAAFRLGDVPLGDEGATGSAPCGAPRSSRCVKLPTDKWSPPTDSAPGRTSSAVARLRPQAH